MSDVYDPFDPPKARAPQQRTRQRDLQMQSTVEEIRTAPLRRAQIGADLDKGVVDKARAEEALTFTRATQDASIRKEIAQADKAEVEAVAARIQSRYPDIKEQQALAAARVILMEEGENFYKKAVKQGYEPTTLSNKLASMAKAIPIAGEGLADFIRDPVSERGAQGERIFTEGALRTVTGSAGPKEERPEVKTQYFPSSWQGKSPETRRDLERLRNRQISTIRRVAGPAIDTTSAPKALPNGITPAGAIAQARKAIADGKDRNAVIQRLRSMGVDPKGL